MKIIITERQKILLEMSPSVRRRVGQGENYIMNLTPKDVCDYWKPEELDDYVYSVLTHATLEVVSRTGEWWSDDDYGSEYDDVYYYLSKKYTKDIIEFFNLANCNK
jgi:hypothetical protein